MKHRTKNSTYSTHSICLWCLLFFLFFSSCNEKKEEPKKDRYELIRDMRKENNQKALNYFSSTYQNIIDVDSLEKYHYTIDFAQLVNKAYLFLHENSIGDIYGNDSIGYFLTTWCNEIYFKLKTPKSYLDKIRVPDEFEKVRYLIRINNIHKLDLETTHSVEGDGDDADVKTESELGEQFVINGEVISIYTSPSPSDEIPEETN